MKIELQALLNFETKLSATGLKLPEGMEFSQWVKIGKYLKNVHAGVQFWVGDWLNYGEKNYGEKYTQALDEFDYELETLMNISSVAKNIPISRRRENVPFSIHADVAYLDEEDGDKILDLVETKHLNRKDARIAIAKLKSGRNGKETAFPKGKFGVIYADCPWLYDRAVGQGVAVEQYDLMELADIKNLEDAEGRRVQDLSADNCLLFLWATFPKLTEALETIAAWGFEYKTVGFTWVKTNKKNDKPFFGIGSYTKSNAEVCLLGTKGDPHMLVKDNSVSSVIMSPLREHSRKPDEARAGIEKLVGDKVPKIELFAREEVKGWKAWGREMTKYGQLPEKL